MGDDRFAPASRHYMPPKRPAFYVSVHLIMSRTSPRFHCSRADFESVEQDRPEFGPGGAETRYSPVNGEVIQFYPEEKRAAASNRSMVIIFLMLLLVIATLVAVYTLKVNHSCGW